VTIHTHEFSVEPANYKHFVDDMIRRLELWSLEIRPPLPGEAPRKRKFNWADLDSILEELERSGMFAEYNLWIEPR
jgi:hypothetical protein